MRCQPSTINPQPTTLNPQPSTLNLQPSTPNPKSSTPKLTHPTLTLSHKSQTTSQSTNHKQCTPLLHPLTRFPNSTPQPSTLAGGYLSGRWLMGKSRDSPGPSSTSRGARGMSTCMRHQPPHPCKTFYFMPHGYLVYRGTSLIRKHLLLGPNSRPMFRVLW